MSEKQWTTHKCSMVHIFCYLAGSCLPKKFRRPLKSFIEKNARMLAGRGCTMYTEHETVLFTQHCSGQALGYIFMLGKDRQFRENPGNATTNRKAREKSACKVGKFKAAARQHSRRPVSSCVPSR
jgi:hypothetical protein